MKSSGKNQEKLQDLKTSGNDAWEVVKAAAVKS
jgi:hypothetical protein